VRDPGSARVTPGDLQVTVADERLVLMPERAAYWTAGRTLFIADPHWGKTSTFRASGVVVPGGTTASDFARLDDALGRTAARRLVILGDLFHARSARTPGVLEAARAWRRRHAELEVSLVPGNHDRHAGEPGAELRMEMVGPGTPFGPWVLDHVPRPAAFGGGYVLAGHLHPVAVLRGPARARIRLPCFHFGAGCGVLPAFGSFTGGAEVRATAGDEVCVIADGSVIRVAAGAAGRERGRAGG
jgi:uncharacterized protein